MQSYDRRLQIEARLRGFSAYLASIEVGPDDGLNQLQESAHPEVFTRKLQILLEAERFSDAADLVRDAIPQAEWADLRPFSHV